MRLTRLLESLIGVAILAVPAVRLLGPQPVPADLVRSSPRPEPPRFDLRQADDAVLVVVRDEHGQPVAGVPVGGLLDDIWMKLGETDAEGIAVVEVPIEIEELAPLVPFGDPWSAYVPVVGPRVMSFEVASICPWTLTLLHEDGSPASGADVEVAGGPWGTTEPLRADEQGVWSGRIRCRRGSVEVRAAGHLQARVHRYDPNPFTLEGGAVLKVQVLQADGTPAAGASLSALSVGPLRSIEGFDAEADSRGTATLVVPRNAWQHVIEAYGQDYDQWVNRTLVNFGGDRSITLHLAPKPPEPSRLVYLHLGLDDIEVHTTAWCAAPGASFLAAISGTTCPRGPAILHTHGRAFELPAGEDDVWLRSDPTARHTGSGAPPYARIYAWPWPPSRVDGTEPWMIETLADLHGNYELVGLTPGRWRIVQEPYRQRRSRWPTLDDLAYDYGTAWASWPGHVTDIEVQPP
jgi:hypothetical protein